MTTVGFRNLPIDDGLPSASEASWRERGFCVLDPGVLIDADKAAAVRADCYLHSGKEVKRVNPLSAVSGRESMPMTFGSAGKFEFPSTLESLNELMLDEKLLLAVSKLLGTTDIFMTQGDAWLKHGVADDPETRSVFASTDQRLHMDFPNHALTAPGDWYAPDAVAVILYLDDARQCDGRTAVVARRGKDDSAYRRPYRMPGVGTLPWINDRASAEAYLEEKDAQLHAERQAMYAREESVDYRIGTALLYRHDVWHRGTPVRIGASRCVVNLVFKRTTASWLNAWSTGTARFMYGIAEVLNDKNIPPTVGAIEIFFCSLSPRQRSVLGFPAPEDEYWTPVALEELEARWGSIGMDTTPYHRAAARADHRQLKIDKLQAQIDRLRAAL